MSEQKKPTELGYDWNKLLNAQVAARYMQEGEEGFPYAAKALERILEDIGVKDPILKRTVSDPQVGQRLLQNYLEEYSLHEQEQTVGDLLEYYSKTLDDYLGDNKEFFEADIKDIKSEKYSDLISKMNEAKHVYEGYKKHKIGSKDDAEKALKIIQKYQPVKMMVEQAQEKKMNSFKNKIEEDVLKSTISEMYKERRNKEFKFD